MSLIARALRQQQTPAERVMWRVLRDRRLRGLKFRRQFPVGPFVGDCGCYEIRLLIELDREVQAGAQGVARDKERDAYLRGRGFTILRLPNQRVFEDAEGVIEEILAFARRKTCI
ncbi:MAG TPA: endonuclease domain-containing protein [Thermoanaerobaculia bacterium]|nr:endonuclease domain-containing protein [Thermoanaerobaculia bacterium]